MSEKKEKVIGTLYVSVNFECPKCEEYLDLFDDREVGYDYNSDGEIWKLINEGNNDNWKNLDWPVMCHKCEYEFLFNEMEY